MVEIARDRREILTGLFEEWEETLLWSCLQGCMGRAWADDEHHPRAAQVVVGDFLFLGGDCTVQEAPLLAAHIPSDFAAPEALVIPQNQGWQELVEQVHAGRVKTFPRYAFRKEPHVFDRVKLQKFRDRLPKGFTLRQIDRDLFTRIRNPEGPEFPWAGDFCANFSSWEEYAAHGCGFVALRGEELVAGASSYTWYREGIEIEIDTKLEYRRKGLALCCASALILHCLDRGLYPSWDAANLTSVALAEKMGYHFSHEYPCCGVDWRKEK